MRWSRRFHVTGHTGADIFAAGLGVRDVSTYLDESLDAGVLVEALELMQERLREDEHYAPQEWITHPDYANHFRRSQVIDAVERQRATQQKRVSNASSGFFWATSLIRRKREEIEQFVLGKLRPDLIEEVAS